MTVLRQRNSRSLSNVANVRSSDTGSPNRARIDTFTEQSIFQGGVVLHVVAGPQDRVRKRCFSQHAFHRELGSEVRYIAELLHLENGNIRHMLQPHSLCDAVRYESLC